MTAKVIGPSFHISFLNRGKDTVLDAGILSVKSPKQFFDIFPPGMSVGGTGTFYDRDLIFFHKADDFRFLHIDQRPYHG